MTHLSVDSLASLSTAAIALAPSTPMSLSSSLPASAEGRHVRSVHGGLNTFGVCRAGTLRAGSVQGGGSREGRHGAALESLAQRGDADGGVGAMTDSVDATERILAETASVGRSKCHRGLTRIASVDLG